MDLESTTSFKVENGILYVILCNGWKTRPDIMLDMFSMFIKDRNIKHLPEIKIDLSDASSDLEKYPMDNFYTISATIDKAHLLLPDTYSLCWPECHIDDVFQKCEQIERAGDLPWFDARLFWRGQNSHWTRKLFVDIASKHEDKIDAHFVESVTNGVLPANEMITLEEHTLYKYLIDLSGQGFSARIKYLMFSQRPLFIVNRDYHDWISVDLIPWVHFIPVDENDLEKSILKQLAWAERNVYKAQEIAENALSYIKNKLTRNGIYDRIHEVLNGDMHHA